MKVDWNAAAWPMAALQSRASREDMTGRCREKRGGRPVAVRAMNGIFAEGRSKRAGWSELQRRHGWPQGSPAHNRAGAMASPGVPTLPTSHSEGMRVPSLGAMGMLPPMQGSPCSSATATVLQEQSPGMIGRMPSFHSIKIGSVAHNDPAELLARARGDLVALPRPDKDEDPAALLLAKAREASGGGGLRRNNSISGISLLPFQSRQLPAPSGLSAPAKALAARGAPALGETTLPLIEQHTQMRLQQQRRQPQGLHLPMAPSAAHVVSPPAQRVAEEPLGMLAGDVGRLPARASEQEGPSK